MSSFTSFSSPTPSLTTSNNTSTASPAVNTPRASLAVHFDAEIPHVRYFDAHGLYPQDAEEDIFGGKLEDDFTNLPILFRDFNKAKDKDDDKLKLKGGVAGSESGSKKKSGSTYSVDPYHFCTLPLPLNWPTSVIGRQVAFGLKNISCVPTRYRRTEPDVFATPSDDQRIASFSLLKREDGNWFGHRASFLVFELHNGHTLKDRMMKLEMHLHDLCPPEKGSRLAIKKLVPYVNEKDWKDVTALALDKRIAKLQEEVVHLERSKKSPWTAIKAAVLGGRKEKMLDKANAELDRHYDRKSRAFAKKVGIQKNTVVNGKTIVERCQPNPYHMQTGGIQTEAMTIKTQTGDLRGAKADPERWQHKAVRFIHKVPKLETTGGPITRAIKQPVLTPSHLSTLRFGLIVAHEGQPFYPSIEIDTVRFRCLGRCGPTSHATFHNTAPNGAIHPVNAKLPTAFHKWSEQMCERFVQY